MRWFNPISICYAKVYSAGGYSINWSGSTYNYFNSVYRNNKLDGSGTLKDEQVAAMWRYLLSIISDHTILFRYTGPQF